MIHTPRILALLGIAALQVNSFRIPPTTSETKSRLCMTKETTEVPVTPCTRICRYNSNVFDGQVCIGCFRDTFEIGSWQSMTAEEKYYALLDAADRMAETTIVNEASSGTSKEDLLRQAEYWRSIAEK